MMNNKLHACAILGLMGVLVGAPTANAQLKPPVDSEIRSYAKADGVAGLLTVAGSETMKGLSHRWESKLRELYPNLTIQVQGIGSETGPPALLEGKAQIAAMSRQMTPQEIETFTKRFGYEPTEVPVAGDALAVFVHRDNPIKGISLQELDAIFCKERRRGGAEDLTTWSQLGLSGDEWNAAFIKLLGRNHASGSATFFREHVCRNGELKENMTKEPGSASVVVGIKKDRYAVGFSGIGYRTSSVKPIPLAAEKGKPFIEPTFETTINGSYPLRRHLYLYVNKAPKSVTPAVMEFVKFAVSQEGQQVVVQEGFFPLPTAELNRHFAAWTQPLQAATAPHPIPARD
jgi:phosphate transport system substrate-binding protein